MPIYCIRHNIPYKSSSPLLNKAQYTYITRVMPLDLTASCTIYITRVMPLDLTASCRHNIHYKSNAPWLYKAQCAQSFNSIRNNKSFFNLPIIQELCSLTKTDILTTQDFINIKHLYTSSSREFFSPLFFKGEVGLDSECSNKSIYKFFLSKTLSTNITNSFAILYFDCQKVRYIIFMSDVNFINWNNSSLVFSSINYKAETVSFAPMTIWLLLIS